MRDNNTPSQNIEAEQALLGGLLLGGTEYIDKVEQKGFRKWHFYRQAHEHIYDAMLSIRDTGGRLDAVTLKDRLVSMGQYEAIGGASYIMALGDIVPTPAHCENYAETVMLRAAERTIQEKSLSLQALATGTNLNREELITEAEKIILSVSSEFQKNEEADRDTVIANALRNLQKQDRGILFGISEIDNILNGVLPGELLIIGARPSVGKTALALSIAHNITKRGIPTMVYQFEMAPEECVNRLLSLMAKVDSEKFRKGEKAMTEEEIIRIAEKAQELAEMPLYIPSAAYMTISALESNIRRAVKEKKAKVIFVDYLEEIEPDREYESQERGVSKVVRRLKAIAIEQKVSMIVLAQLNRNVEHRMDKTPMLSDLRGSGKAEAAADNIILLHELEEDIPVYDEPAKVNAIVAKGRHGRKGIARLLFNKPFSQFTSKEWQHE